MRPFPADLIPMWPISTRVNKPETAEAPGAGAKTALGQRCRTPCQLGVQPGNEFSVTLALSGYQLQTVIGASGGAGRRRCAAIRTQSGSRHLAGGDASEEAGCEEKEAGCGSGPSGSSQRFPMIQPNLATETIRV